MILLPSVFRDNYATYNFNQVVSTRNTAFLGVTLHILSNLLHVHANGGCVVTRHCKLDVDHN